jgi:5-(carboxyamino)imidazole ribonucleotide mutase
MPGGIPVATVALNGAKNAGILAASMVGAFDEQVGKNLDAYKKGLQEKVEQSAKEIETKGWKAIVKK